MGTVSSNVKDGGMDLHRITKTDKREAGAEDPGKGVGDASGRGSSG